MFVNIESTRCGYIFCNLALFVTAAFTLISVAVSTVDLFVSIGNYLDESLEGQNFETLSISLSLSSGGVITAITLFSTLKLNRLTRRDYYDGVYLCQLSKCIITCLVLFSITVITTTAFTWCISNLGFSMSIIVSAAYVIIFRFCGESSIQEKEQQNSSTSPATAGVELHTEDEKSNHRGGSLSKTSIRPDEHKTAAIRDERKTSENKDNSNNSMYDAVTSLENKHDKCTCRTLRSLFFNTIVAVLCLVGYLFSFITICGVIDVFVEKINPYNVNNNDCRNDNDIRELASEQLILFVGAILVIQTCSATLIDLASKGYFHSKFVLIILVLAYFVLVSLLAIIISVETPEHRSTYLIVFIFCLIVMPVAVLVVIINGARNYSDYDE